MHQANYEDTTCISGGIASIVLCSGTGYAVNDTGVILGGKEDATYLVTAVDAGTGAVTALTITAAGTGYSVATGVATRTGGAQAGAGVGLRVNIATLS